ncbi:MAG: thioredoxin family protein [Candidatus Saccharimonadales bacterium]
MNKKLLIIAILAVTGIGGGVLAYTNGQSGNNETERMAMEKKNSEDLAMKKYQEAAAMAMEKETGTAEGESATMTMSKGSYTDYDSAKLANAETGKVVLFFHAPWCPTCKNANDNFKSTPTPDGLTLLKVDYDSSNELKKKYGVTYQHTFVQVDKAGNLLKKWNGSNSYDAIKAQEI